MREPVLLLTRKTLDREGASGRLLLEFLAERIDNGVDPIPLLAMRVCGRTPHAIRGPICSRIQRILMTAQSTQGRTLLIILRRGRREVVGRHLPEGEVETGADDFGSVARCNLLDFIEIRKKLWEPGGLCMMTFIANSEHSKMAATYLGW